MEPRKMEKMYILVSLVCLHRGAYMSAHVSLNLNELKTGALMLDSIYYLTLKLIKNRIFGAKLSKLCHIFLNVVIRVIMDVISLHY